MIQGRLEMGQGVARRKASPMGKRRLFSMIGLFIILIVVMVSLVIYLSLEICVVYFRLNIPQYTVKNKFGEYCICSFYTNPIFLNAFYCFFL